MKKFCVIGLGSMGKRRIRCLKTLGYNDIIGIDPREDRRNEVDALYQIKTKSSIDEITIRDVDAYVISTPPDKHTGYLKKIVDQKKPAFVEASVILDEVKEINDYNKENVFIAPSCTLRFHPVIKDIKEIIDSNKLGKVTNFTYHSGQYLPDWHPWEKVNDFYVSNRVTGGGREIVPFELTWIIDTIGYPDEVKGYFKKTIDFGADIEDTYAFILKYPYKIGAIIVDVASRYAIRHLIINLERGQIQWNWDDDFVSVYNADKNRWVKMFQPEGNSEVGYNKNLIEEMYIDEIKAFIDGIKNCKDFPNTLNNDIKVLELLNQIENSDGGF